MTVHVRRAASSDVEDLVVLLGQLGYPVDSDVLARRSERLAADESTTLFVAVTGAERVIGLAAPPVMQVVEREESSARLVAVVVHEDARGRGIARWPAGQAVTSCM
jgi:N-acetylglutamate synthase-like GNAT family acetyltransferase